MRFITTLVLAVALGVLASCAPSKFKTYNGPEVTQIYVRKSDRQMFLMHHDKVLKRYDIALGFAPEGHKQWEGDGRTPEGLYYIDRHNGNSAYHLSVGISYPNEFDVAWAETLGKQPGGDIFIHGRANAHRGKGWDWTAGCIAVKDDEIEDIYAMVRPGTPILIVP